MDRIEKCLLVRTLTSVVARYCGIVDKLDGATTANSKDIAELKKR